MSPLPRFLAFYAALFGAFGVASPFLPGLLKQNGLSSGELGVALAAGAAIRLVTGPMGGWLADRGRHAALVLAAMTGAAAVIGTGYLPARGLVLLTAVIIAHAAVLAPLTPVADALALGSAEGAQGFPYGWVRGAGSAAFIVGTLASGQLVEVAGLNIIIWLNAGMLGLAACLAAVLPNKVAGTAANQPRPEERGSLLELLRIGPFVWMMGVVALVGGSHALHDGFEVIRWRSAGLSSVQCSMLWGLSVAAEVVVFVGIGPKLLALLGPAKSVLLSACCGIVRWGAAAVTAWFPAMAVVEPLHGMTFALLHLACMEMIGRVVPARLAATAQAFYGTIAMGATTTVVTLGSGELYGRFGSASFWAMAFMCGLAIPLVFGLRAANDRYVVGGGATSRYATPP